MNCEQVQALLLDYAEGEITPSQRALLQAHLADCTVCQQELDLLSTARSRVRSALQRRAVQAVPARDAWNRLEARLTEAAQPSSFPAWLARKAPGVSRASNRSLGAITMRKRYILGSSMAILAVAVAALLIFNNVVPVSAQTILERASAVQAAQGTEQGIQHTRIEIYRNPQALTGSQAGETTIDENYYDPATGYYRFVTRKPSGQILQVFACDGSFTYAAMPEDIGNGSIVIHRTPFSQDPSREAQADGDSTVAVESAFEHFRTNPRVELLGKETWIDGRQVYVLANRNSQTQNLPDGQMQEAFTGTTKMLFDAQTYQLVESETTVYKDGQEIVIEKVRFLVDEILQPGSQVNWDLSDLQNTTFVDDPQQEPEEVSFEVISAEQLAAHTNLASGAYILQAVPDGFTLEIVAAGNQPQDQPYAYEIHYKGSSGESFVMHAVGVMDTGFVETAFYDGSYKSLAGLVLNYSSSRPENSGEGTAALLIVPDGTSFLIHSTLSRAEVQTLVEDLVPLK